MPRYYLISVCIHISPKLYLFLTGLCQLGSRKGSISLSAPELGFCCFLILPFKTLEGMNVKFTDILLNFIIPSP